MDQQPPSAASPAPAESTWWTRNWKWLVPLTIIVPMLLCGTCFSGMLLGIFAQMREQEVAQAALERAMADPRVIELVGEPIQVGAFTSGSDQASGSPQVAMIIIPLNGSRGSATIEATAEQHRTGWSFRRLIVVPKQGGEPIDLLAEAENGSN